jgi:hypothetical protein
MTRFYKFGCKDIVDEAYREEMVTMMRFLKVEELIKYASELKKVGNVYYLNENEILDEAIDVLGKGRGITPNQLDGALRLISDMEYAKKFHSDKMDTLRAVAQTTEAFLKKAAKRGHVDENGFFWFNNKDVKGGFEEPPTLQYARIPGLELGAAIGALEEMQVPATFENIVKAFDRAHPWAKGTFRKDLKGALKKHIRLGRIVKEIDDGLEVYRFKNYNEY